MKIQIESASGMILQRAQGSQAFAAKLFKECQADEGCLMPARMLIDGDEYFAEDIAMLEGLLPIQAS